MNYPQEHIKPYGTEGKKSEQVEQMFDNIAPAYDMLNHTLSLGIDKSWRRKAIKWLRPFQPQRVMDVATGTGDFAILAYDMLRPGDWIKMDKFNADGIVTEVTLNIVKIRNWDNTIITIPTYLLVSDSFQNWRAMWESGRRRIKEILYIDVNSVHFCDEEEKARFEKLVKNCPATVGQPSNLHYFRYYMENHIAQHPKMRLHHQTRS